MAHTGEITATIHAYCHQVTSFFQVFHMVEFVSFFFGNAIQHHQADRICVIEGECIIIADVVTAWAGNSNPFQPLIRYVLSYFGIGCFLGKYE